MKKKTHPSRLDSHHIKLFSLVYTTGGVLVLALLYTLVASSPVPPFILGFLLVIPLALGIYSEVMRRETTYYFTDRKIIEENGLIDKNYKTIDYDRIQNVTLDEDIEERIFSVGDIVVNTAGTDRAEQRLNGLKKPENYRRLIGERMESGDSGSSGGVDDFSQEGSPDEDLGLDGEFGEGGLQDGSQGGEQLQESSRAGGDLRSRLDRVNTRLDELDRKRSSTGLTDRERKEWYRLEGKRDLLRDLTS